MQTLTNDALRWFLQEGGVTSSSPEDLRMGIRQAIEQARANMLNAVPIAVSAEIDIDFADYNLHDIYQTLNVGTRGQWQAVVASAYSYEWNIRMRCKPNYVTHEGRVFSVHPKHEWFQPPVELQNDRYGRAVLIPDVLPRYRVLSRQYGINLKSLHETIDYDQIRELIVKDYEAGLFQERVK